jgi:YD repeat-containing protein
MALRLAKFFPLLILASVWVSTLQAAGDFSLSASPTTRTVTASSSTTYTITVSKSGNFSGVVSFTTSGLPSGASASFSPTTVTAQGSTTMTVTTSSSTPGANSTVTVTGTSGSLVHTTSVTLQVNSFNLSVSPGSQSVAPGGATTSYTVTVAPSNGFSGTVAFTASGLPTGASASFNPTSVAGGSGSTVMTVTTTGSTPSGTSTLTITGTSGGLVRTTTAILQVTDFSLSASPGSQTVNQTDSTGPYTVTVTPTNGFSGTVTFAVTGLPTGATASFSPSSVTGGSGTTAMTVATASTTPTGTSTLTITGTSGSARTTTVTLTVLGPPITYTYDALGRLTEVVDTTGEKAIYNYDAVGNLLSIVRQGPSVSILSFSPASGSVGTAVTISGTGFSSVASQDAVAFNGTAATVTSASITQVVATVPSGATTGTISITAPSGSATSSGSFTVTAAPAAPTIGSFTPSLAAPSTPVTISGTNFDPNPSQDTVKFNGAVASVLAATATTIQTAVPAAATSGRITVQTLGGQATTGTDFFVAPPPYSASNVGATGRLTIGASTTLTLGTGKIGVVVFDASQGQAIRLLTDTLIGSTTITIYNPDDTVLLGPSSVGSNGQYLDTPTLPATGTYTVQVVPQPGSSGSISLLALVLPAAGDFSVAALLDPPQTDTANTTYSVYVNPGSGFTGTVTFTASGLPAGATASFSPSSIYISGTSRLMIATTGSTPAGSYTITITGTSGTTRTTTVILGVNPLPNPWTEQDIGSVTIPGRSQVLSGVFTVQGQSGDIFGTSDSLHFAYQALNGDGTLIARLSGLFNGYTYSKVGIMIRESVAPGAANIFFGITNYNQLRDLQYRSITGSSTTQIVGAAVTPPQWLKLVRRGNTFIAYYSLDGVAWTAYGSPVTVAMATAYAGLAVSSADGRLTTATFDNVSLTTGQDFDLTVTAFSAIRVDSGSLVSYVDAANQTWSADYGYSGGSTGWTTHGIAGTVSQTLYQNLRYAAPSFQYQFAVPNGTYAVRLKFAELYFSQSGQRVFNVLINGQTVLSNFDIVAVAGAAYTALDRQFNTTVSTGQLVIQFTQVVDSPIVNAIEILSAAGSGLYTVNVDPLSGFPGAVTLTATNLPAGGSAAANPASVTPPGSSSMAVSTDPSTPQGTYAINVVGTSGSLSHTVATTLKVDGADFVLSVSPSSATINAGQSKTYSVTSLALRDFAAATSLSISGLPAGATASFSPSTLSGAGVSSLTVTTSANTPGKTYTLTITGTSGNLTHSIPVTLVIVAPDFTMSASPLAQATGSVGGTVTYTVTVGALNGFNKTIALNVSGLPSSVTATLNPVTITGSGTSTLTVTVGAGALPTSSVLTVFGTGDPLGGNIVHWANVELTVSSLLSPWLNQDVGGVPILGSGAQSSGTYTIQSAGHIWTNSDAFQYVYQPLAGDGTIVARVSNAQNLSYYAQLGVMIRETLANNSVNAFVTLQPNLSRSVFQWRPTTGASTTNLSQSSVNGPPYWLKLVRQGSTFTGWGSNDGINWGTAIGSATISMATNVFVGLAVDAESDNPLPALATAIFDQVKVTGGSPDFYLVTSPISRTVASAGTATYAVSVQGVNGFAGTVSLSASGVPANTTATFSPTSVTGSGSSTLTVVSTASTPASTSTLTITGTSGATSRSTPAVFSVLPSTWANQDLGSVGRQGNATFSNGTYTVQGSGTEIWNAADSFQFVYRSLTGDGTVVARVSGVSNVFDYSEIGVMIRETLTAGSKHAMMMFQGHAPGTSFIYRDATGGSTSQYSGNTVALPSWLKLIRQSGVFKAYYSSDGTVWTKLGNDVPITMNSIVYVGLAVCAENNTALTTASFDNVTVVGTTADFYLSAKPNTGVANLAGSTAFTANVNALNNFAGSVSLSVSGLPTGATGTFNPTTVTGSGASTLTVTAGGGTPAGNYIITVTGTSGSLSHSTTASWRVTGLPSPWLDQDIGLVGISGGGTYSNGTFTVQGSGDDIWSVVDGFHFVYRTMTGDSTIIARVGNRSNVFAGSKAGVMIRETPDAGASNAMMLLQGPALDLYFTYRNGAGSGTGSSGGTNLAQERWVKVVRQGSNFTAYTSQDGGSWIQVGGSVSIPMNNLVYVGLAVSAVDSFALTTAAFDSVTVTSP